MNEAIIEWLIHNRQVKEEDTVKLSARLCGNWSFLCYVNGSLEYFIKSGCFSDLDHEFNALKYWHHYMPAHVPKPFYLGVLNQEPFYIQKALSHQVLSRDAFLSSQQYMSSMREYFLKLSALILKKSYEVDSQLLLPYISSLPIEYLQRVKKLMKYQILQHGDLTLNNIGATCSHLLIFDWEDYGKTSSPGLDLSVFLMSLCDFDTNILTECLQSSKFVSWLGEVVGFFDMNIEQFLYCIPYNLALFSDLKKKLGYGKEVVLRSDKVVDDMCSILQGVNCA